MLKTVSMFVVASVLAFSTGCRRETAGESAAGMYTVVTSDTLLSEMAHSLLSPEHFEVAAIMPPDQCPGHYDLRLSDIERVEKADLVVYFRDLPFMDKTAVDPSRCIVLDQQDRNWMAPDSYVFGLNTLAGALAASFPTHEKDIAIRLERAVRQVREKSAFLKAEMARAGIADRAVLASSMQLELLQWMGLRILETYDRPESMSLRDVARITESGRNKGADLVVDNLQSGPDAGRSIASTLGIPHVVLSNFPFEKGYAATLEDNVASVLAAVRNR